MSIVAIIPARAGSKGLPDKNIKSFRGIPLLVHSVLQAKKISLISRIIVSTDSQKYADIATAAGAEVPTLRPAELATDQADDLSLFKHCLGELEGEGMRPELFVHLRPTYPLRTAEQIERCIRLLLSDPSADSVRSVAPSLQSPYKMYRQMDGYLLPAAVCEIPEAYNQPRQILPKVYEHNGAIDVVRASVIRAGSMSGSKMIAFEMAHNFDIDSAEDFLAAERSSEPAL